MKLIKHWPIIFISILSVLVIWPLFLPGYFSHHDDLQVMRIYEMKLCLLDLQIPCRWVADMGYGNGYPLFNYYNPLPYYIGAVLSFILPLIFSAKILFFISLTLAAFSMYFLAKEMFGKEAGFFASILYLFAPYRALDIYVRGAIAESLAISIFPLVLYFVLKLIKTGTKKFLILSSIALAAFLTSHTIMTLLFLPLLAFMIVYWVLVEDSKMAKKVILGIFLGIGLSAFFTLPAYFEKNLVQIDNLTKLDLDFRAHFVTIKQLFLDRTWGHGASFPGPSDTISFQIGWPYWILAAVSIPLVLILKRRNKKILILYIGISIFFILSVFMTHSRSAFIWEKIGILRFAQFPWRFLAVTIFTASLLGAFIIYSLKPLIGRILMIILVLVTVILNWGYFQPEKFIYDLTDNKKLSGSNWETQQKASILDYLPIGAGEPIEPAPVQPIIRDGKANIINFEKKSNSFKLDLDVQSAAKIEIPIIDFPVWKMYQNGKEIKFFNDNYVKRISLNLEPGNYKLSGKLTNTPIRTISNLITFLSILIICYIGFYAKTGKNIR